MNLRQVVSCRMQQEKKMRMVRTLAGFGAACICASLSPGLTNADETTAVQLAQAQDMQQAPGSMSPGSEQMRDMMRQMMQEMMGNRHEEADEQPARGRERHHASGPGTSGEPGMMRGSRGGERLRVMHGAGMKIAFAITDADGDGQLSLPEIQDFHARIFNAVDGNDDGRVGMEEIESFFHGENEDIPD